MLLTAQSGVHPLVINALQLTCYIWYLSYKRSWCQNDF